MLTNVRQTSIGIFTGTIDGIEWQNITDQSRFWPDIQAYIAAGGIVIPPPPSPYHDWNGTAYILNLSKMNAGTINAISDISKAAQDSIVRSPGKSAEYDRNIAMIAAAESSERTAFLTAKSEAFAGWKTLNTDGTVRFQVVSGNVQSYIDYVNDARTLCLAAGDAIVNERGNVIQRINQATDLATAQQEIASFQAFCDGKLAELAKQTP